MQISRSVLAVNCHGWEDFPTHYSGSEAAELLACWTTMWHPGLLAADGFDSSLAKQMIPSWHRIDESLSDPVGTLLIVPSFLETNFDIQSRHRINDAGGCVITGHAQRQELVDQIQSQLGLSDLAATITDDFFALGYCYLQIMLMTRQLRYSSSLDEEAFAQSLVQAAEAARRNQVDEMRRGLGTCFDLLIEERSRYYPTDPMLVDYVLVLPSTLGKSLQATLAQPNPLNLQLCGETLQRLASRSDTWQAVQSALEDKRISIVGGQFRELASCLLSTNASIHELQNGHREFDRQLNRPPAAFARRRFGLASSLPGRLHLFGQEAAVHSTMDEGSYPQMGTNNMRWEGDDGTTIDALASVPRIASAEESYLDLGVHIGELLDSNHFATVLFAHWPGHTGTHYQDLVVSSRYGNVLGQFVTLEDYFEQCSDPGYSQTYSADDYRDPYLAQIADGKRPNPISRFVEYWQQQCQLVAWSGLQAMRCAFEDSQSQIDPRATEAQKQKYLDTLANATEDSSNSEATEWKGVDIDSALDALGHAIKRCSSTSGRLVVNPFSFKRRAWIPDEGGGQWVDVPPMGYARVPEEVPANKRTPKRGKSMRLVDDRFLRNEFFETEIDETTGGIRSIQFYNRRGNLLAQQIARRVPDSRMSRSGTRPARYSQMIGESLHVEQSTENVGVIKTTGRLVLTQGQSAGDSEPTSDGANQSATDPTHLANFVQTVRVVRSKPIVEIDIEIDPAQRPSGTPWDDYYACRFAWNDEGAEVSTYINESRQVTVRNRMVGPLAIHIDHFRFTTSILSGGLPFHRRIGYRRLDSLLIVRGEQRRHFKMGIGIDLKYPLTDAMDLLCPPLISELPADSQSTAAQLERFDLNCMFHLNCKNVVALDWNPIQSSSQDARPPTVHPGCRVVIQETEGRAAKFAFTCCRPLSSANQVDFVGNVLRALPHDDKSIQIELNAHELAHIEILW